MLRRNLESFRGVVGPLCTWIFGSSRRPSDEIYESASSLQAVFMFRRTFCFAFQRFDTLARSANIRRSGVRVEDLRMSRYVLENDEERRVPNGE